MTDPRVFSCATFRGPQDSWQLAHLSASALRLLGRLCTHGRDDAADAPRLARFVLQLAGEASVICRVPLLEIGGEAAADSAGGGIHGEFAGIA